MPEEILVPIHSDLDIVAARQRGREMAARAGFSPTDVTLIATTISELARNIVLYARQGEIVLRLVENSGTCGLKIVGRDAGPGIRNLNDAMRDGYSTSGGLGLGLPGIKRLMDDFEIRSEAGEGTTVSVCKWRR